MSYADTDAKISRLADDLFYVQPLPSYNGENMVLYQILDQAPQGRKLMNYLTHLRLYNGIHNYNGNRVQEESVVISQKWREEEKRINPKMSPATLQLETPVIFSWSRKAQDMKMNQISRPQSASVSRGSQESTNNRLYKTVITHLDRIRSVEGWDSIDSFARKTGWTNSEFKVDPLQPFVARFVKEPKTRPPKKEKTPSKMKNLFSFLSNSGKKQKPDSDPRSVNVNERKFEDSKDVERKEQEREQEQEQTQEQEQKKLDASDTVREQASLPSGSVPKSMEKIGSHGQLNVDSFIPLQPKKKH